MGRKRVKGRHRQRAGATPGTLVASPEALESEGEVFCYDAHELWEDRLTFPLERSSEVIWINLEGLSNIKLIKKLGAQFGIHKLDLEDVLYGHRSKAEWHHQYLFLSLPMLHPEELEVEQMSLFLTPKAVLTFQNDTPGDCLEPVRNRLRKSKGVIRERKADYLAYAILDAVIDAYYPVVDRWNVRLAELEDELLEENNLEILSEIRDIRRQTAKLRRSLRPLRDGLLPLLNHPNELLDPELLPFYNDCRDHLEEILEILSEEHELTRELLDIYNSRISQRSNEAMQTLTVIATIFIPLSFIAGVYGMNFDPSVSPWNMPELRMYFGYPAVLSAMLFMTIGFVVYFRRRGFL